MVDLMAREPTRDTPANASRRRLAWRAGWGIMAFCALAVTVWGLAFVFVDSAGDPALKTRYLRTPWAMYAHILGGAAALGVGAFQFLAGLRAARPALHRTLGRVYLVGVLVGGVGGLRLATFSAGGWVGHVGFGALSTAWLLATLIGYLRLRKGAAGGHGAWMVRSYALTLAAVTIRIYLPLLQSLSLGFERSMAIVSWSSWITNLLLAEWILRRR
ncbi:MAG: hypothetical protein CMJ83_15460 [Planctomycetes bacterium]|nr:hypothetical protein [Planctomycetota bacterium]